MPHEFSRGKWMSAVVLPFGGRATFQQADCLSDHSGVRDDGHAAAWMPSCDAGKHHDHALAKLPIAFASRPGEIAFRLRHVAPPHFRVVALEVANRRALELAAIDFAQPVVGNGGEAPAAGKGVGGCGGAEERTGVERSGRRVGRVAKKGADLLFAARTEGQIEPAAEATAVGAGVDMRVPDEQEPGAAVSHARCGFREWLGATRSRSSPRAVAFSRFAGARRYGERSASGVAFFFPRIGGVGVAADLPEAEFVLGKESDAVDELRALPRVEFGNDHAGRAAVFARERSAVEARRDQNIIVDAGGEWRVG